MSQVSARSDRSVSSSPSRPSHAANEPPALSLPQSQAHKCLLPVESPLSQDGELSARNVMHRTRDHFTAVVQDTTWLLDQALASGAKRLCGGNGESSLQQDRASTSPSGGGATGAGGDFFPSSKTRRQVAAQSQRAFAFFRLQQFARAVQDYDACLASEPTAALLYYNRGCTFYAWNKKDRATQDFSRALKIDCKNVLYVESRAVVYKELGRFQEAIQDYTWLETLRRMAHHGCRRESTSQRVSLLPVARDRESTATTDPLATVRGSFSMSLSELQVSLLGAAVIGTTSSGGAVSRDALTTEQRERQVLEWMIRFLQQSPRARSRRDTLEAAQYAKSWCFFRGMSAAMVEQCLDEAVYARFDADALVVEQGKHATHFHVVLSPTAPFVRNIDALSGVSKLRELKKLFQGDAVGSDAFAVSSGGGLLRTIRHEIAAAAAATTKTTRLRGHHGSLLELLNSQSLVSMLTECSTTTPADTEPALVPPEPASLTSLEAVHCLLLDVESYREILHEYEESVLEQRTAFLRGCRVFHNCSDEVLTALAAVSGARVDDPGTDLLCAGENVSQLYIIQRGVCQVRKTIRVPAAAPISSQTKNKSRNSTLLSQLGTKRRNKNAELDSGLATERSGGDGSWVLDNGWMLTNPRLVNTAQGDGKEVPMETHHVDVGILASGQVFGELSVLQPGQPSPVTVHAQTLVETLVLEQRDLARLRVQYHSGTMNALQESLLFHNPPQQKILQLQRDLKRWDKHKQGVLRELALQLPTKARSALRAGAAADHSKPAQSPSRRRASMVGSVSLPKLHPR